MCLVNRVDKLTLEHIDRYCLLPYADYNQLMNSFVLRIVFCNGSHNSKVTLEIFLLRSTCILLVILRLICFMNYFIYLIQSMV